MAVRDQLITIERETNTRRPGGGLASEWTEIGELWVAARWVGGGEGEARGAVRATARYRFIAISADVEALGVTTKDRIVWNGEPYNIRETPRRLRKPVETEIIAETGVTQ